MYFDYRNSSRNCSHSALRMRQLLWRQSDACGLKLGLQGKEHTRLFNSGSTHKSCADILNLWSVFRQSGTYSGIRIAWWRFIFFKITRRCSSNLSEVLMKTWTSSEARNCILRIHPLLASTEPRVHKRIWHRCVFVFWNRKLYFKV